MEDTLPEARPIDSSSPESELSLHQRSRSSSDILAWAREQERFTDIHEPGTYAAFFKALETRTVGPSMIPLQSPILIQRKSPRKDPVPSACYSAFFSGIENSRPAGFQLEPITKTLEQTSRDPFGTLHVNLNGPKTYLDDSDVSMDFDGSDAFHTSGSPSYVAPNSSESSYSFQIPNLFTGNDSFRQENESSTVPVLASLSKKKTHVTEKYDGILRSLRNSRLSPFDFLLYILDPTNIQHEQLLKRFYEPGGKLASILDMVRDHPLGRKQFDAWNLPHAVNATCSTVYAEMDDLTTNLVTTVKDLTPAFLRAWTLENAVAIPARARSPTLLRVLNSAIATERSREHNKKKTSDTACYTVIGQLISRRSQQNLVFSGPMSLFFWKNGASRQTLEVLYSLGLAKSYNTVLNIVENLAEYSLADARIAARSPDSYLFGYDNINMSTSIFVEQRSSAPAKVQSGTHAIIYKLRNPNPNAIRLAPILARARIAEDLNFERDISPTIEQMENSVHQMKIYVIRVLCRYHNGFKDYANIDILQNKARRPLPAGYKTQQFPLKISTIDESTITGNIAVLHDTHINQLNMTHEQLSDMAIISTNDQATQARIRGAKALRAKDINPFTRIQCFQLAIGLFHLCLNMVWALLHVHRGHLSRDGSLSHWFAILEKTRLGSAHPDYHSLLTAMMQILDGLLLDAWRIECGYSSLNAFATKNPTPNQLLSVADKILANHATPLERTHKEDINCSDPVMDKAHQNTRLLVHDLLYVAEVTRAISAGDWGRVEDILPQLAMIFRGAGSKNYCTEILHFIHNLKKVWKGEGFE